MIRQAHPSGGRFGRYKDHLQAQDLQAKELYHNITCKVPVSFEHAYIECDLYFHCAAWKKIKMSNPCLLKGYCIKYVYTQVCILFTCMCSEQIFKEEITQSGCQTPKSRALLRQWKTHYTLFTCFLTLICLSLMPWPLVVKNTGAPWC